MDRAATTFRLSRKLADLSLMALRAGHKIKLSTLLKPIPSQEEIESEAELWDE